MARNRLTHRIGAEDGSDMPYPGSVNQPDRKFVPRDKYDNYEEVVNYPLPDMRHEWQDNPRDEIGFGTPKQSGLSVASVRVAANKAVRIAVLLLGEKVGDDVIEAQARDIMGMNAEAMDRTLGRFAETQKLYEAADEVEDSAEDKVEDAAEAKEASAKSKKAEDEKKDEPKAEAKEASAKSKKAEDEKKDEPKAEEKKDEAKEASAKSKKAEDEAEADEAEVEDEADEDEAVTASDELVDETGGTKPAENVAQPTVGDEDKKASVKAGKQVSAQPRKGANEMDIELSGPVDDEMEPNPEADAQLASIFDDDSAIQAARLERGRDVGVQPKKAGIKKIGGQPRAMAASGDGSGDDLSGLWKSAPDVNEVFK